MAIPVTLPAQIGCLGRYLVSLLGPRTARARTAAIDSTVLWASGGVVPRSSIDTASYWTKSGRHG